MEIQTFYLKELNELVFGKEWEDTVKSLNLEGQIELQIKDKIFIPFTYMNKSLFNIFNTLCPIQTDVNAYSISLILLEVLKLIELCRDKKYFNNMQIWLDNQDLDHILVGSTGYWYESKYFSDTNYSLLEKEFNTREEIINAGAKHPLFYSESNYLLAKWGNETKTLEELKEKAILRYTKTKENDYNEEIQYYKHKLSTLKEDAFKKFN